MRLLVDEMYPPALADGLRAAGIEATTVAALGLAGSSDAQVFAAAVAGGYAVLTANVGDLAADRGRAQQLPGAATTDSSSRSRPGSPGDRKAVRR